MLYNSEIEMGSIGSRLREARKKAGLTQEAAAEKLGIPKYQTISAYENDKNAPKLETLKDFCRLYGVTSDYILFGSEKSVIKSVKDYLLQLVESADFFEFPIRKTTRPVQSRNGYYSSASEQTIFTIELDPHTSLNTSDFERFLVRWHDLRNVLDTNTIGKETYDSVLAQKADELDEGVFSDLMPF